MKKIRVFILLFISVFTLAGCNTLFYNEIHNRSVNYEEITIDDLNMLTTTIVDKTRDSVIGITNYRKRPIGYERISTGSGVILECVANMKDGSVVEDCMSTMDSDDVANYHYLAVTNRHVVEKGSKIKVYIGQDDVNIDASVIKADNKVDLAVIEFSYIRPIQPIEIADSDLVKPGNIAIAIGSPYGHEFWGSATFGIISSPKRYMADDTDGDGINDWDNEYIQHDVAINKGNSGGALLNAEGKLIGINTLKFVGEDTDGMGFSIPSNVVKEIVTYLREGKLPRRVTLGISFYSIRNLLNPDDYPIEDGDNYPVPDGVEYGFYIIGLDPFNSYNKNFAIHDIVLSVNGVDIKYSYEIREQLNYLDSGEVVEFLVLRNGEEIIINVTF